MVMIIYGLVTRRAVERFSLCYFLVKQWQIREAMARSREKKRTEIPQFWVREMLKTLDVVTVLQAEALLFFFTKSLSIALIVIGLHRFPF